MVAYSGTRVATTRVRYPYPTTAPIATGGYSLANPAPFILVNNGRGGSTPEKIQLHSIEVVDQSWGDTAGAGKLTMQRVTLNATDGFGAADEITIFANDSLDAIPTGLKAYMGVFPYGASEIIQSVFSPSYQSSNIFSIQGNMGTQLRFGGPGDNLTLQDGQGFVITSTGNLHSSLDVTIGMTANGHRYFLNSFSGTLGNIASVSNRTGAPVTIDYVNVSDVPRSAYPTINYTAVISSGMVRVDRDSNVIEFDSQYSQPDWIDVGRGFFAWSMENWIDYAETIATFVIPKQNAGVGLAGMTKDFMHMHKTTRILLPGQALVIFPPSQQSYFRGETEIKVTYSTYSLEMTGGGGGEYSYAY
jgi:hypothetical protein